MEQNNNDNNPHYFYFLVRNYVENNRKEDELFSILETELSQEQLLTILEATSDLLRFLRDDVQALKYYIQTEKLLIEEHHIQHFIDRLKDRLPKEDKNTFLFPDYRFAMAIEKIKRAIKSLNSL